METFLAILLVLFFFPCWAPFAAMLFGFFYGVYWIIRLIVTSMIWFVRLFKGLV